ncbi:MAG TPA: glycerol-3-phosphate dehydrogenase [Gemmatimonadaceae bacterium]|nr:glycerol-3-phosphate dehydrogenase [Gemmatimonadaceae bacterium]
MNDSRFNAAARGALLSALATTPHDLLVIGGGITGAGIARDAAMRGLTVALVERDDFASGTSSRSSRLVHGGLRYLEQGALHLVFEASRERQVLRHIAPHLVQPLRFIWPVYAKARIPRWKLGAGLWVYDALALFRNIARHHRLSARAVGTAEPALREHGLRGGFSYYDAHTDDIRLTLANARAAAEAGAVVLNHVEVRQLVMEGGAVSGAVAVDTLSGNRITVAARSVVNATGPWSTLVSRMARPEAPEMVHGTKGVHIAVPRGRIANRGALTLLSPIDGRVMFILPAGAHTIIGTTDTEYPGPAESVHAARQDVTYLLRSANAFFPGAHLGRADVVSAWAGVRPLAESGSSTPDRISREHRLTWTAPGLLTITGGKLTTYRVMAAQVVDAVAQALGVTGHGAPTDHVPLPGGAIASLDAELAEARAQISRPALADHLVARYGSEWRAVWAIVEAKGALAASVVPSLTDIAAELVYAVEQEMALTLADLLIRRLHIAFETHDHGLAAAPAAARVVAPLLGWSAKHIDAELARYQQEVAVLFKVE